MSGPNVYFNSSFGGIDLLIIKISTKSGRDIAVLSPSRGDTHTLQDRGRKHLHSSATVLFIDQPGRDPYLNRFDAVRTMAIGGGAQIFSHPILGSYRARIEDFDFDANASELSVEVSCTILGEDEPQLVFPASAGTSSGAGVEAVTIAGGAADTQLAAIGLSTPVTAAAVTAVTAWDAAEVLDSSTVFSAVATLTGQINTAVDTFELVTDISRWQAYRAMIGLSFALKRAAEAATQDAQNVISVYVPAPTPMLALCARLYGSALAQDRADAGTRLNRLRRPGRVEAGTTLKMPADGVLT